MLYCPGICILLINCQQVSPIQAILSAIGEWISHFLATTFKWLEYSWGRVGPKWRFYLQMLIWVDKCQFPFVSVPIRGHLFDLQKVSFLFPLQVQLQAGMENLVTGVPSTKLLHAQLLQLENSSVALLSQVLSSLAALVSRVLVSLQVLQILLTCLIWWAPPKPQWPLLKAWISPWWALTLSALIYLCQGHRYIIVLRAINRHFLYVWNRVWII